MSPRSATAAVLVASMSLAACSSHRVARNEPATTTTTRTPATTTPAPVRPPTTTTLPPAVIAKAAYGCGPTDGPWIDVTVTPRRSGVVLATLVFRGRFYGRSEPVRAAAGVPVSVGFDPGLPSEAYGHRAGVAVIDADRPGVRLAQRAVELSMPPGMSCG